MLGGKANHSAIGIECFVKCMHYGCMLIRVCWHGTNRSGKAQETNYESSEISIL